MISVMVAIHLPAAELRQQTSGDATLHDHTAASMLDSFDLSRLVEQRN
jgi:hypothetical protein